LEFVPGKKTSESVGVHHRRKSGNTARPADRALVEAIGAFVDARA
jgi:hypothetical protein